jgi:cephalosporin hydroxylase
MSDATPSTTTTDRTKRVLTILAIGFACLSLVQFGKGFIDARAHDEEKRALVSPRMTIDRFHNLFYNSPYTIERNQWMGIRTVQNPNDMWITQEILFEVKPDFVVEAGTYMGGSAILWAMVLREINPASRIITIDIEDRAGEAKKHPLFKERVDSLVGNSIAPEIVAEVKRRVAGRSVVLILDSNHHKEHVLAELRAYADIVQKGGYVIVQDSNINGHPVFVDPKGPAAYYAGHPGPMEAIDDFLAQDKRFEVDPTRERLLMTVNPRGYLKRVR